MDSSAGNDRTPAEPSTAFKVGRNEHLRVELGHCPFIILQFEGTLLLALTPESNSGSTFSIHEALTRQQQRSDQVFRKGVIIRPAGLM